MKILCIAVAAFAVLAAGASGETNSVSFTQDPGDDGQYHYVVSVNYDFPGLPPRSGNYGAGTVRVTLPGSAFALDPSQPPPAGYSCFVAPSKDSVACSNDGQQTDSGLTFPTAMTVYLVSPACWPDGSSGAADVWAAPDDPGTAPDASLPVTAPGGCDPAATDQPVLEGHVAQCRVPKLARVPLASATRRLRNAHCARGKVRYVRSKRVKRGRVVSQSVRPGKLLAPRTRVNLVVSKGA